jgi:hypothetical protein
MSHSACPITAIAQSEVTTHHTTVINFDRCRYALNIFDALSRPRHNRCTCASRKPVSLAIPAPLVAFCIWLSFLQK